MGPRVRGLTGASEDYYSLGLLHPSAADCSFSCSKKQLKSLAVSLCYAGMTQYLLRWPAPEGDENTPCSYQLESEGSHLGPFWAEKLSLTTRLLINIMFAVLFRKYINSATVQGELILAVYLPADAQQGTRSSPRRAGVAFAKCSVSLYSKTHLFPLGQESFQALADQESSAALLGRVCSFSSFCLIYLCIF